MAFMVRFSLILFFLTACEPEGADRVWIYQNDGSKACEPKTGQNLKDGAASLRAKGIQIHDQKKTEDGLARAAVCGIETGKLNAYLISKAHSSAAEQVGFRLKKAP